MDSSEAMDVLMGQGKLGSRKEEIETDTQKYFEGFGRIPKDKLTIKSDIPMLYGDDIATVTIESPYKNVPSLEIALTGDTDDKKTKEKNLQLSELAFEYYHTRDKSRRNQIIQEVNKAMDCKDEVINGKTVKVKPNKLAGSFVLCK